MLYDRATHQVRATLGGQPGPVRSLAFTPDGTTLVAGTEGRRDGADGQVQLWNPASAVGHRGRWPA